MRDQVFDGFAGYVEFAAAAGQQLALLGEVLILLKGLLVDVSILFERLVDFAEACRGLVLLSVT